MMAFVSSVFRSTGFCLLWCVLPVTVAHADDSPGLAALTSAETITTHKCVDSSSGAATPYLLYHPVADTSPENRSLLIFLFGAGGSHANYNLKRPPYAKLRDQLAKRGYYVVVPGLGPLHFMNDKAKDALDGVVRQVLKQQEIPADRVHVMGTSMGGGSSLAYAIHRPDLIQSVCAVMPMTDFGLWVVEKPHYFRPVANAFGGTPDEVPGVYAKNSAVSNVDAFRDIPVMLVHGTSDRIVQYSQSEKLAKLLREQGSVCEFYTAKGMTHKDDVMQEFQIQAADFFDAAVK